MNQSKSKPNHENQPSLKRALGVFDGIAILVGITIGAGIYSTPQIIARYQTSFESIISLWILVGIFVFIGGLIYAELGTRLPNTGGEYVYIHRCFGPFAGFMFGWAQLFIIRTSAAAGLALITVNYIGYFIELSKLEHTLLALLVIVFLGVLNYIGIEKASFYQKLSTVVKIGGLFLLVAAGIILIGDEASLLDTTAPAVIDFGPIGNTVAVLMMIVFSHTGWDRIGYSAGEMKNPRRVIPLSLLIGMGIIILLYTSANFIYYQTLGIDGLRTSTIVASDTATKLVGPTGAALIAILVMISASGSINGTMMTAPRVYYAMAKDGLFFRWLDHIHPKYQTPSRAILVHCLWAAVILIMRGQFQVIAAGMVFAILIFYAFTTLALFKLRHANAETNYYRMPFYPILPGIYLAGIVLLLIFRAWYEWENSLIDIGMIATGIPFALFWNRKIRKN
ncbi:MAG: amino acid permease [Calditrichaeota bacterium]|nr:MAG: amino acid permease [Calditrichota bacterium]